MEGIDEPHIALCCIVQSFVELNNSLASNLRQSLRSVTPTELRASEQESKKRSSRAQAEGAVHRSHGGDPKICATFEKIGR